MNELTYLNFHTHQFSGDSSSVSIYNARFSDWNTLPEGQLCSLGIHPWWIREETWEAELEQLGEAKDTIVALGECGLDRLIDTPLSVQEKVFEQQLIRAENWQKPVIIHCVRAFQELTSLVKRLKISVPLVIHGYNANQEIFSQLLKQPFYFSLGAALLKPESNATHCLQKLPLDRLFLETDDKDISIERIFAAASQQLRMPADELNREIWNNFQRIRSHS